MRARAASLAARAGLATLALALAPAPAAAAAFEAERLAMVAAIEASRRGVGERAFEARVMEAMARVPRHEFVPAAMVAHAYENRPLAIGHGQTISQPFIVALMTHLLGMPPGARVLEVGTGSGYQAAVLAELGAAVHTIEIIEPLAASAKERLARLGYRGVSVTVGDGYHGIEAHAPFDAIIVTAAATHVPPPLVKQLKPGGRMVIPVGAPFLVQNLMVVEKAPNGAVRSRQVLPVRFVPLTGGH